MYYSDYFKGEFLFYGWENSILMSANCKFEKYLYISICFLKTQIIKFGCNEKKYIKFDVIVIVIIIFYCLVMLK